MAEQTLHNLDASGSEPRELDDLVNHWVHGSTAGLSAWTKEWEGRPTARVRPRSRIPRSRWGEREYWGLVTITMEGNEVYLDKLVSVTRTGGPPTRLTISGAIDYYNSEAVAAALTRELHASAAGTAGLSDAIDGNGDLHLDVSRLEFADVTGIRALVRIAETAAAGRRLVLRGLPARIRAVITVIGWSDLPNLVIEDDQ